MWLFVLSRKRCFLRRISGWNFRLYLIFSVAIESMGHAHPEQLHLKFGARFLSYESFAQNMTIQYHAIEVVYFLRLVIIRNQIPINSHQFLLFLQAWLGCFVTNSLDQWERQVVSQTIQLIKEGNFVNGKVWNIKAGLMARWLVYCSMSFGQRCMYMFLLCLWKFFGTHSAQYRLIHILRSPVWSRYFLNICY